MVREIVFFKSEKRKDLQGVSTFLHQHADRLAQNQITLRRGEEEFTPDFPNKSVLELKVEEEDRHGKTKRTLEIEIEWIDGDDSGDAVILV
jgi:amphi-Trp domain-containing protein